eukprot:m.140895 g.140895  ORF g.140895 m.140895 type:complete len:703 (-) comp14957_c5_seq2:955-3063(-)
MTRRSVGERLTKSPVSFAKLTTCLMASGEGSRISSSNGATSNRSRAALSRTSAMTCGMVRSFFPKSFRAQCFKKPAVSTMRYSQGSSRGANGLILLDAASDTVSPPSSSSSKSAAAAAAAAAGVGAVASELSAAAAAAAAAAGAAEEAAGVSMKAVEVAEAAPTPAPVAAAAAAAVAPASVAKKKKALGSEVDDDIELPKAAKHTCGDVLTAIFNDDAERYLAIMREEPKLLFDSEFGESYANPTNLTAAGAPAAKNLRRTALYLAARDGRASIVPAVLTAIDEYAKRVLERRLAAPTKPGQHRESEEETEAAVRANRDLYLDIYLNSPACATPLHYNTTEVREKLTPLHAASMNGHLGIVKYLVGLGDRVKKDLPDGYGRTPAAIACTGEKNPRTRKEWGTGAEEVAERARLAQSIRDALEGRWYLPIVLGDDGDSQIAQPWSPDVSPAITRPIQALAGPLTPDAARQFARRVISSAKSRRPDSPARAVAEWFHIDAGRGKERGTQLLAKAEGIAWEEYWPFLGRMCDLSSQTGLDLLERHLHGNGTPFINGSSIDRTDVDAYYAVGDSSLELFPHVSAWAARVRAEIASHAPPAPVFAATDNTAGPPSTASSPAPHAPASLDAALAALSLGAGAGAGAGPNTGDGEALTLLVLEERLNKLASTQAAAMSSSKEVDAGRLRGGGRAGGLGSGSSISLAESR